MKRVETVLVDLYPLAEVKKILFKEEGSVNRSR